MHARAPERRWRRGRAGAIGALACAAVSAALPGCTPAGATASTSTAAAGGASAAIAATAGAAASLVGRRQPARLAGQVAPGPLLGLSYALVKESDGNRPGTGDEITLLFGANGTAFVYGSSATQAFADEGSYAYGSGRLSLHIHAAGLDVDASFPLATSGEVTMPFQALSAKAGTSTWLAQRLGLDQGMQAIYNAALNTSHPVSPAQGASEAYDWATGWIAATGGALEPATLSPHLARAGSGARPLPRVRCGSYCVSGVQDLGDDILVTYRHAPSVLVQLYTSNALSCGSGGAPVCEQLVPSALASDPRVHLDPTLHPDSQFDPPHRSAVLIAPVGGLDDPRTLATIASVLEGRGYEVKTLGGTEASLLAIVTQLRADPGLVLYSAHGNAAGQLLTGQSLSEDGYWSADREQSAETELEKELSAEGLASLTTYRLDGEPAYYVGEPNCSDEVNRRAGTSCDWKVAITPAFWSWLRTSEHVDLSHSLVFVSACATDATAALREQVRARAYFAFSADVAPFFADATELYLVESLARPTHSAEEAFYNMVRIGDTHQMIYKQDTLLQGVLGGDDANVELLDGWGWNGSSLVEYRSSGWLSGRLDEGQVWWMLYAARWNTDASAGAAGLQRCYDRYWSHGDPGGLASPYCNAANAGDLADAARVQADVDYAAYLLVGKTPAGLSPAQLPPRFTLAD